ncbi:MAG: OmpH family outer membrane protein [Proteobacteria bacterium]|nr:OmpH family outer membrane protein [Pseudomonadota bacterium]
MKRPMLCTVAAIALLAFASPAMAADAPAPAAATIAVVNIQQVMRDSTAAQNVREQLEAKQKTFQADISKKEEALQKEDKELTKKRSVLSKEAFDDKARAFRTKATDVQKEVQSKKAVLDAAFERALAEIQKSVTEVISEMSKEKGFSMAVPTSQILYADSKMDISAEVLSRLNQKLPKLDVKFDAVPEPENK